MSNEKLTTWYDLTNQVKACFNEHLDYLLKHDEIKEDTDFHDLNDDGSLDQIIDGCVPIYTADSLSVAISNLALASFSGDFITEGMTAVEFINANIYQDLSEYLGSNGEDWLEQYKETNLVEA